VGPETILNFPEGFGIDSGANLERLLGALLRGKGLAPNITFRELAGKRLGPALRVFATNMNRCVAEEFSAKKSPDTGVRFAVQASMGRRVDRSLEQLGSSDTIIVKVRRLLMEAVEAFLQGRPAPWREGFDYQNIRSQSFCYEKTEDWRKYAYNGAASGPDRVAEKV
jgi:hypothetical protein